MIKPHIVFDKNNFSIRIKNFLYKKLINHSVSNSNLIIVIGGDGFMLEMLKKYNKYKKPFYGINSGNYGFLMNKFSTKHTIKNLSKGRLVSISPLEMTVRNKSNLTKKAIAINEISILRQSRQAATLSILNGGKTIIKRLVSDGVLVSTPAGSTAYKLSVRVTYYHQTATKVVCTAFNLDKKPIGVEHKVKMSSVGNWVIVFMVVVVWFIWSK